MFQLIISILAIILAVALAGVSVYYGGSAFSNGSESAQYATLTNQGAQIEAANTLFRAQSGVTLSTFITQTEAQVVAGTSLTAFDIDGTAGTDVGTIDGSNVLNVLVETEYLKQVPAGSWTIDTATNTVRSAAVPQAVCNASDNIVSDGATSLVSVLAPTGVSGCLNGTDSNVFFYSL